MKRTAKTVCPWTCKSQPPGYPDPRLPPKAVGGFLRSVYWVVTTTFAFEVITNAICTVTFVNVIVTFVNVIVTFSERNISYATPTEIENLRGLVSLSRFPAPIGGGFPRIITTTMY